MKVKPPSPGTIAISNGLSSAPPKRLSVEQVRAQVSQHLSESKTEMVSKGYSRFAEDDRSRDIDVESVKKN